MLGLHRGCALAELAEYGLEQIKALEVQEARVGKTLEGTFKTWITLRVSPQTLDMTDFYDVPQITEMESDPKTTYCVECMLPVNPNNPLE